MKKVKLDEMNQISHLFKGIGDSMVIACLQGYLGEAYVDQLPNPNFGLIVSGGYCFFGGDAKVAGAKALVESFFDYVQGDKSIAIYADGELQWRDLLISVPKNHPEEVERYGIVQKDYEFDPVFLKGFIDSLPEDYELVKFNEDIYHQAMSEPWSMEFCENFSSAEEYLNRGFGFAVIYNGKLVSGASTWGVYDGGIETQIATRPDFQRKGLVLPCAAAFLLECNKRGVRPCWDAATLISRHIALKFGYEYRGVYSTVHMHR